MHHGQSRGKRNAHKVCKKLLNLLKTGGGKFVKLGGNNNFCETGEKCTIKTGKIEGEFGICCR